MTLSLLPIENEFQFRIALPVDCWISVLCAVGLLIVAWPLTTVPPAGSAFAGVTIPATTRHVVASKASRKLPLKGRINPLDRAP